MKIFKMSVEPLSIIYYRYKMHEDGYLRLQTVRYESVQISDQMEETDNVENESSKNTQNSTETQSQNTSAPTQEIESQQQIDDEEPMDLSLASSQNIHNDTPATSVYVGTVINASDVANDDSDIADTSENDQENVNTSYNLEMLGDVAMALPTQGCSKSPHSTGHQMESGVHSNFSSPTKGMPFLPVSPNKPGHYVTINVNDL